MEGLNVCLEATGIRLYSETMGRLKDSSWFDVQIEQIVWQPLPSREGLEGLKFCSEHVTLEMVTRHWVNWIC